MRRASRAGLTSALVVALAVALVPSAVGASGSAAVRGSGPPSGMQLVFSDTFSGSALSTAKWDTCYPWANSAAGCTNFGNPELEWMLPSQAQVAGNGLHLVSEAAPTPGTTRSGAPHTYDYRSGLISSYRSFAFQYGYVEVRARPPSGEALWTAFWLLSTSQRWPPEIDIADFIGTDSSNVRVVYHPVRGRQHIRRVHVGDQSQGFHTYAMDWEPHSISWFVDGKRIDTYEGPTPTGRMYLLADLAIAYLAGAKRAAGPPATASLDVASVAVYQR